MVDYRKILQKAAEGMPPTRVMEVCGTHTQTVARYAIRELLPQGMELISGPGCPVCVTDDGDLLAALYLVRERGVALFSFGDMLRVPVRGGESLLQLRGLGGDVRIALSPMDALDAAIREPEKQFVWFGVGFETTAPLTAAMVLRAYEAGVSNLSVLCAHKTMPAALRALLSGNSRVHALLCPGHVAVITGADAFRFVPEKLGLPGAVSGFQPGEILTALEAVARMRAAGEQRLVNCYPAAVTEKGNPAAQRLMERVFVPCTARWRGLGEIGGSGLALSREFSPLDARARFSIPAFPAGEEKAGCLCPMILRGEARPGDCPLFGRACTPAYPAGPCMVSSEGACAAAFRYGEERV